ncbi:HMG-Y-related protein B-like protein [Tanacetum coccineum]
MAAEQPPASSIPVLPPYPELILAAIEAIGSKNGATKTKISRQILSTYDILPAAHTTLLSHHLNKMKASGQLVFVTNNYAIPDPNSSPKRGRGRPAKPKELVPEGRFAAYVHLELGEVEPTLVDSALSFLLVSDDKYSRNRGECEGRSEK